MCVFAGSLPREVDTDIYARPDPRAAPARRRRRWSTPTATRCAAPCAPSRTSSRRTCSRPRSSSATSSTTTRTAHRRARDVRARRARGDHDDARRLLRPDAAARGRRREPRALPRARARRARSSRARPSAPATPSWPASSPPATTALGRRSASPTASPAAPSRRSTSAPAWSTPSGSSRLRGEVEVERPPCPPRPLSHNCARWLAWIGTVPVRHDT